MHRAVAQGDFKGFRINDDVSVDILQFADDTVILGDGSSDNLWSIKAILRGFELMSGMKVKFFKSKLYGVNVCDWLLSAPSSFLACSIDQLPFKFLGNMVGDSPRMEFMWKDLITNIRNK